MGNLDGRRNFPRLSIGMVLVWFGYNPRLPFVPLSGFMFCQFLSGIGKPPGNMDMKAFLLQKFSPLERKQIDEALEQGSEAVKTLVLNGFNQGISRFNLVQKYKFHKV